MNPGMRTPLRDHYQVLGVPREAAPGQIKKAYRQQIKKFHPDVNHSAEAAETTRELNESYAILSDTRARSVYDMDLKLEESTREETFAPPPTSGESDFKFAAETTIYCERCRQADASLRICAIWAVFSFVTYSRKISSVKILCARCRVLETLTASAFTLAMGWWSLRGIFWTLEALAANALGGDQPEETNAALLKVLSYQLYRAGRQHEAYEALSYAMPLRPDLPTEQTLAFLKQQPGNFEPESLWRRFLGLRLNTFYYHALLAGAGMAILIYVFS